MKLRTLVIGLSVVALSAASVPLLASADPGGGPGCGHAGKDGGGPGNRGAHKRPSKEQRAKFKQKMQARFGKMLRTKMQLPEAKAKQVETLVGTHMKQKRPLHKQIRQYHVTLRNLLKDDSADQQAFADALKGLKQTREAMRILHASQVAGLQKLLTPKQQAQLLSAHHKMRRHMRRGRRGGPKGKRGPPRGEGRRGQRGPGGDNPEQG